MTSVEAIVTKLIKNEKRGLISVREAINEILLMMAEEESGGHIYDSLPPHLKTGVDVRLREIAIDNISWHPLIIGEPLSEEKIEAINIRLRGFFDSVRT